LSTQLVPSSSGFGRHDASRFYAREEYTAVSSATTGELTADRQKVLVGLLLGLARGVRTNIVDWMDPTAQAYG
jgi:hypothetical protein